MPPPFPDDEELSSIRARKLEGLNGRDEFVRTPVSTGARNLDNNMSARLYRYFVSLRQRWNEWCAEDKVKGLHAGKTCQIIELERMYGLDRETR